MSAHRDVRLQQLQGHRAHIFRRNAQIKNRRLVNPEALNAGLEGPTPMKRAMRRLSPIKTKALRDHMPMHFAFFCSLPRKVTLASGPKIDRDKAMLCWVKGVKRQEYIDALEAKAAEIDARAWQEQCEHSTADHSTETIIKIIQEAAVATFPPEKDKDKQLQEEKKKRREMLQQRWRLREQLEEGDLELTQLQLTMLTKRIKNTPKRASTSTTPS